MGLAQFLENLIWQKNRNNPNAWTMGGIIPSGTNHQDLIAGQLPAMQGPLGGPNVPQAPAVGAPSVPQPTMPGTTQPAQQGLLQRLFSDPQAMGSLAQLGMLIGGGKLGGYGVQGYQGAQQQQIENQLRQQQIENQLRQRQIENQLRQRQLANQGMTTQAQLANVQSEIKAREEQRKTAKLSEVTDMAKNLGISFSDAAAIAGVQVDPIRAQKIDERLDELRQQVYIDMDPNSETYGQQVDSPRPGKADLGVSPKMAPSLIASIQGRVKKQFYVYRDARDPDKISLVSEADAKKYQGMGAQLEGPFEPQVAVSRAGQLKPKETTPSEMRDEDILALGAQKLKKTVAQLTPQERAQIRKDYEIEIAGAKASQYGTAYQPVQDASGKPMGFVNKATGSWVPYAGPEGYIGGSANIPQTASDQLYGMKTSLDQLKTIIPDIGAYKKFGPAVGRVTLAEVNTLGGLGASKEDLELAVKLHRLVTSEAFANGGKQLTPTELNQFIKLNPSLQDTFDNALIKAQQSQKFLKTAIKNRIMSLGPRARDIVHPDIIKAAEEGETTKVSGQGGSTTMGITYIYNGQTLTFPDQQTLDAWKKAAGIK